MTSAGGPGPSIRPIAWRSVTLAALIGALAAYGWFAGLAVFGLELPRLSATVVLVISAAAVIVGRLAYMTHRVIQVRRELIASRQAVVRLALGKTALLAGAALAGAHAAVILHALPGLGAAYPRERVGYAAAAAVAGIGLAIAGRMLERACEIPESPDRASDGAPEDPGAGDSSPG